jgi:hypothetical protein
MGVVVCQPGDPEAKGVVERAIGYLETSFLPGRRFANPADFNSQLAEWLHRANNRVHRTLRIRPSERIDEDRAAMMGLPPVLPEPALRFGVRLGRDHYVRVGTNDYSVHPRAIGRRVEVRVDAEWVVVTCAGVEVARHQRAWGRHRVLTDPDHERARIVMRATRLALAEMGEATDDVEVRDLAVYDRATGAS